MALAKQHPAKTGFLSGAGEMGSRILAHDWSRTRLGPIECWPLTLKTSVSLILGSRHPMWIGWGPEMTFLYNDAYVHVLGSAKHPGALGLPASQVWAEVWDVCGPLANKVFENGEASFVDDVRLLMNRVGYTEETFYSFSYSPIRDDSGRVCGLFCPSTDVTPKILNTRRLATLSELASNALTEKTAAGACAEAARILEKNPDDIPFALLYLVDTSGVDASGADANGHSATLEQAVGGFTRGFQTAPVIALDDFDPAAPWPIAAVYRGGHRETIGVSQVDGLPRGAGGQRVTEAVVLPVAPRGEHKPYGVLVAGVNPGRPLDTDHLTFFELLAGQVATAIQNARSIEEEKKRADALAEIDRAKTAFFSNVSHEFRTPLTLMLGPLEDLLAKPELRREDHEQLEIAYRNSLRLLKLVNSLLDFARLEAGRLAAHYAPADLATLTADVASSFRSAIESAGLEFAVNCEPLPEPVYVDREMWERIVLNLLSNAFKFTFEGGVSVRLRAEDGQAVLSVRDTGIGIREDELPRIFERFYRVEDAPGRTYEGSGIGLALIQEYVKLHGGSIRASSRVGEGSTFTIALPFGKSHLAPEHIDHRANGFSRAARAETFTGEAVSWLPREEAAPHAAGKVKPRILLADDNADMREYVRRILSDTYDVSIATDGRQALDSIRENAPDLLLSDIMMPGLNGLELLRAVREDERTRALPVIFLSARAGEEKRIEGLLAGAHDYLVKPFTASELRARVGTHLELALTRRQASEREAALRAEAEAARDHAVSILENLIDGFISLNRDWRITDVNRETENLTGMGRKEMIGRDYWEVFPELAGTSFHREFLSVAQDRVTVDFEDHYQPWKRWFRVKAYPGGDGGISVFFEDVTERRNAESALRESEERFRAIVETTPDCVCLLARDGALSLVNSAGAAMLGGESAEQLRQKSFYDLVAPEFREEFRAFHEKICRGEKGYLEFDLNGLDGRRCQMEIHSAPLRMAAGATVHLGIAHDITDRARRERASLLLGAIVDSSDDAIVSKNLNGIITSWNKSAELLFGFSAEEAIGQPVVSLIIPPDRQDEEPKILERMRNGERVDHFETVRRRKDGRLLDISLTISPVRDAHGRIIGASKIARDISDRKRAEAAIQSLNSRLTTELSAMTRMQQLSTRLVRGEDFEQLLGEIIDAVMEITGSEMGNIQLLDEGKLTIVAHRGFDGAFLDFFNTVERDQGACGTALARGRRVIIEDVATDPIYDEASRAVLLAAGSRAVQSTPLVSRSGHVLGIFSTHYRSPQRPGERELRLLDVLARQAADLIERKRAEAALFASEAKFRHLANAMPQIVWTARADGYVDYYNERWYEFTGLARDPFGDEYWPKVLHPDDIKRIHESWGAAVRNGLPFQAEDRFWDRQENRWRWFMGRALPAMDESGRIVQWFGTWTDIDEQKRVEVELRRANQDLEQFAYSASHDLQEPLRSIKIYGELLSKRYASKLDGQAFEFLGYLRAGASRMESLVRDLLAYTQVTRIDIPAEPADSNEALRSTLENLATSIAESGAKITFDPLPPVRMHRTHLRQLFQNLIGDAIKYRDQGRPPEIHVSAERQEAGWIFSVRDNGIGIEPEYKEHIFGLFKRLHTGDRYSGTGIGLAICQRIVERYNGGIWVESRPGTGSTFRFSIPF
jgi:PAS domain S-box-containing protein